MKRIKKEHREKILEKINPDTHEISWNEDGVPYKFKKKSEIKKGRISRARGARFELKVREDLESRGWIMDKWTNNVDLSESKLMKAKRKYNPFKKMLVVGTGFPDFIAFRRKGNNDYEVIGVEVKINGLLSKIEKEKCVWYLNGGVFSRILIAKAVKEGRKINIEYVDFRERFGKLFV